MNAQFLYPSYPLISECDMIQMILERYEHQGICEISNEEIIRMKKNCTFLFLCREPLNENYGRKKLHPRKIRATSGTRLNKFQILIGIAILIFNFIL